MNSDSYEALTLGWSESLRGRFQRRLLFHCGETGSTNDDLLAKARAGTAEAFELHVADCQTRGRGRRGDPWSSAPGKDLLFSLALPLPENSATWSRLPHLAACFAGSALESILLPGKRISAKWPNDLLYEGKKLAGILVETLPLPVPFAIVGMGINVNMREDEIPPDLRPQATTLYEILECESNRWFILGLILQSFLQHYPAGLTSFESTLEWMRERDWLKGRRLEVETPGGILKGTGAGLSDGGELLLRNGEGALTPIVSARKIALI